MAHDGTGGNRLEWAEVPGRVRAAIERAAGAPLVETADPRAVDSVLAAIAGYFVHSALLPAPPGLPTLREFQRLRAGSALAWPRSRSRFS